MRRTLVSFLTFALVASGFVLVPAGASEQTDAVEVRLLQLINQGRQQHVGKGPEVMHSGLRQKARVHSQNMSNRGSLTHDGFSTRINTANPDPYESNGAPDDGFNGSACENVAMYGPGTTVTTEQVAQKFYSLWYNSTGHRNCMFDSYGYRLNAAGLGVYVANGRWWATFESARDNTPPTGTTPPPTSSPAPTPTPTATWTRVQETGAGTTYAGSNWTTSSSSSAYGGSYRKAATAGHTVVYAFTGTGVRWVGLKNRYGGRVEVRLDGALVATVDCYVSGTQWKRVLFQRTGLTDAAHQLELRVTGTKRSTSRGRNGYVDAFEFLSS